MLENFDIEDFHRRWQAARNAALKSVGATSDEAAAKAADRVLAETSLLSALSPGQRELALRAVFDHSRMLGLSAVRRFGIVWEAADLGSLVGQSGIPCFLGQWSRPESAGQPLRARILTRTPTPEHCPGAAQGGSFICDYWREAIDGLVMGLGEELRHRRHESVGHGDAQCLDLFLDENGPELRYGPIDAEIAAALEPLRARIPALVLVGCSEGVLYYKLESATGPLCGPGGKLLHESVAREISSRFPRLRAQDASPLAVYGGPQ
ncbi:MAG: hypothetical protein NDJ89_19120 [Oligoflexia bacterium]|nr:hypothetical protein [Oligoflexia bacterium]